MITIFFLLMGIWLTASGVVGPNLQFFCVGIVCLFAAVASFDY